MKKDLTPREAAQQLGIRLDSLYKDLWTGRLAGRKEEGRWVIPGAAVEDRARARGGK